MNEKICRICGKTLPSSEFYKNCKSKDGRQSMCKECARKISAEYRNSNRERVRECGRRSWNKHKDDTRKRVKQRAVKKKQLAEELKRPCVKCGENRKYLIDFHHIDPLKKEYNIATAKTQMISNEKIVREIEKCVCLCSNCHREFHHFYGHIPNNPVQNLNDYLKEGIKVEYTLQSLCSNKAETMPHSI